LILLAWIRMGLKIEYNGFWGDWDSFDLTPTQVLRWTEALTKPSPWDKDDDRRFRLTPR
jgi:hypothetical protein